MEPPDDVPSLEELGSGDDLPGYWAENTTISVSRMTKHRLDEYRDGRPWDEYLEKLRREHADPITLNDVEELAEYLTDAIGAEVGGAQVDDSELAREVVAKIDYAEISQRVAKDVAEELRR